MLKRTKTQIIDNAASNAADNSLPYYTNVQQASRGSRLHFPSVCLQSGLEQLTSVVVVIVSTCLQQTN